MPKITKQDLVKVEGLLDSPSELQAIGAAVIHNFLKQAKPGTTIDSIKLPLVDARATTMRSLRAFGPGPWSDSIGGSVNAYVSLGWSKDISKEIPLRRDRLNAAKVRAALPKGLENLKILKVTR